MAAIDIQLAKNGLLPVECSSLMRAFYCSRLQSDYGDTAQRTKADATLALANAEHVVSMLRGLQRADGAGGARRRRSERAHGQPGAVD